MKTKRKSSIPLVALAALVWTQPPVIVSATPAAANEADAFVASTAVATHWRFNNVYLNYPALSEKLIDAGIRHSRDTGTGRDYIAKLQKLADAGVRNIVTIHPAAGTRPNAAYWANPPALAINDYVRLAGRDVIAFAEMNNELDMPSQQAATYWRNLNEPLSADPASAYYFVNYARAATADAWAQLAGDADPSIAALPLIGPSFTTDAAYSAAGDLSAHIEYSNIHHYLYGWHPETTTIRGIDDAVDNRSQVQGPGRGMIATEGAGATAASLTGCWPLTAHGRYIPRYYLTHFLAGFAVTTAYELVDEGVDPANQEHNFGLLKNDLSEKPAYTALKNMLSVLGDPGPSFAPGSLDYTLSGSTADVRTALFRKRNGDFYLCLWLGLPCYNPLTGATISVPAQAVSLTVPSSIVSARVFTLNDSGAMAAAAASISGNSIALNVTDRITIVRLSTAANGGAASTPAGLRAAPASGQIALKWAPVYEATSYTVKRAAAIDGSYSVVASGLSTPAHTDTGLPDGTACYYVVSATNAGGTSADSPPICAVPAAPVVIDNTDAGVTLTGAWTASTSTPGYQGTNFLHDGNTGAAGGKSVRFAPNLTTAGSYDVYLRWPANTNRATNTPVEIVHAAGTHTTSLNQQLSLSSAWILLGTFHFNAGTGGSVCIQNDGANGYVIADAARFELTVPRPPSGLTATTDTAPVALAWDALPGALSYSVKRAPSLRGPYTTIASGLTTTSHTDTTAAPNVSYYYAVSTKNAGGESRDSAPVLGMASAEIVVDNADATGVAKVGTWIASTATAGYQGINYLHDGNTGATGGRKVTFSPALPVAGSYKVYLRWTAETNRASNAPVDVLHAGGTTTVSVNQRTDNGAWVLLGTYTFSVGGSAAVAVRNDGANGFVIADAVKFVLD
ncbi:MAG TPA: hypothetical protein VGD81_11390 [Opitutaceae bacterium]